MNGSVEAIKSEKKLLLRHFLDDNLSRFETLFACNPDSIFTMDLEGHIVQVNPAFESLTEFSAEESLRLKLQFLFPIEDMNKIFHHFHKASFGEFQNFDCRIQNKAGKLIDLNVTQIPISVENQIVGVLAVGKDITHLKRKKEEARKVEVMHHILTDNVLDIIISTNLSGEILYVSPSSEHILGYSSEELYRKNIFSFIHTDDTVRAFQDRKRVLNEHVLLGVPHSIDNYKRRNLNVWIWLWWRLWSRLWRLWSRLWRLWFWRRICFNRRIIHPFNHCRCSLL